MGTLDGAGRNKVKELSYEMTIGVPQLILNSKAGVLNVRRVFHGEEYLQR